MDTDRNVVCERDGELNKKNPTETEAKTRRGSMLLLSVFPGSLCLSHGQVTGSSQMQAKEGH